MGRGTAKAQEGLVKEGQVVTARDLELAGYRKQSRLGVASGGTGMDHLITYINPALESRYCLVWRWEKDPLEQQGRVVKIQSRAEYDAEWERKRAALLGKSGAD
jgi:hypothetical protein